MLKSSFEFFQISMAQNGTLDGKGEIDESLYSRQL